MKFVVKRDFQKNLETYFTKNKNKGDKKMNVMKKCLVGHDDDYGWLITISIAIMVVMVICAIIVFGGAFIGGFHSIKNYILAFKNNVIDSNRAPIPVA